MIETLIDIFVQHECAAAQLHDAVARVLADHRGAASPDQARDRAAIVRGRLGARAAILTPALYAGNAGGSKELRLRQDALLRRRLERRFGPKRRYLAPTKAGARLVARWGAQLEWIYS
jgi:hypothetical protein